MNPSPAPVFLCCCYRPHVQHTGPTSLHALAAPEPPWSPRWPQSALWHWGSPGHSAGPAPQPARPDPSPRSRSSCSRCEPQWPHISLAMKGTAEGLNHPIFTCMSQTPLDRWGTPKYRYLPHLEVFRSSTACNSTCSGRHSFPSIPRLFISWFSFGHLKIWRKWISISLAN